jgi:hypothetical protein
MQRCGQHGAFRIAAECRGSEDGSPKPTPRTIRPSDNLSTVTVWRATF